MEQETLDEMLDALKFAKANLEECVKQANVALQNASAALRAVNASIEALRK